ncbi:hypothetical protein PA598K_03390 [Paenibacillus sp. 598K]|nr:hypothetical protein PA598K_03390 [Paenibacillus sp. 598K]
MRDVQHGLRQPFEPDHLQLIEQDRQEQRRRERDDQIEEIEHQRVAKREVKVPHAEHFPERLEADPFAAKYPLKEIKVLEGYLNAIHRTVSEDQKISQR